MTLTDTLPAGVDWVVDATIPAGIDCQIVDLTLTCDLGDLAPEGEGDANHVFIYLAGETSFADCANGDFELLNSVVVSAANEPVDAPLPNSDQATIEVDCPAIGISKDADHEGSVSAGDEVGFTVTIGNTGDGTAFDVSVSDELPAALFWALDTTDDRWQISGSAGAQVLVLRGRPGGRRVQQRPRHGDLESRGLRGRPQRGLPVHGRAAGRGRRRGRGRGLPGHHRREDA